MEEEMVLVPKELLEEVLDNASDDLCSVSGERDFCKEDYERTETKNQLIQKLWSYAEALSC